MTMVDEKQSGNDATRSRRPWSKWCRHGCSAWCVKYFWEGQLHKNAGDEEVIENADPVSFKLTPVRRKLLAFLLPAGIFHFFWWSVMIRNDYWHLFPEKYIMAVTMIIGSLVAGMTSEGGGAVAFPVMTLALGIAPSIARDFSFMVQTCGMSCASFAINFMHIKVEKSAVLFCSMGAVAGLIFGFLKIDPNLTPAQKKMGFVSIWFSFAFTLYLLNRDHKRKTFLAIPNMNWWKAIILILTGFTGGCFSSFAGSGTDICSFAILCLLFRVSEKVATPTSVVLMAINSCIGLFFRAMVFQDVSTEAWEFIAVCAPIVVIGAPTGAILGSHFHRLVLASFVYAIDLAALIGAFAIVPQTPLLAGMSCGIIVTFFIFFGILSKLGKILMAKQTVLKNSNINENVKEENGNVVKNGIKDVENGISSNGELNNGYDHNESKY